ncbi:MAG: hypothetical protein K0Q71_1750 [Thermomicrobiales bacterium]|jgi:hypothetical protein|nr:hypothetical protein [Thermomicrobiales bacterium]
MRLELNPLEFLTSVAGGIVAALLVVLVLGQFSPVSPPVRATLVNCAAVRARSRQDRATPMSAQERRIKRQCAALSAGAGGVATPPARSRRDTGSPALPAHATKMARTHGWRKAATPSAN